MSKKLFFINMRNEGRKRISESAVEQTYFQKKVEPAVSDQIMSLILKIRFYFLHRTGPK